MEPLNINNDISKAETLPASFYRSQEIFDKMKESIFLKSWHWIGDKKDILPLDNYAYPHILLEKYLNEPVVLVRDKNEKYHCMSNVCTHRGNLVVHQPGKIRQLLCMYHGRRFNKDGTFKSMPEFEEAKDFPRACDHLHPFDIQFWKSHIFINLEPSFSIDTIFKVLEERVGFLPLDEFKYDKTLSKDYLVHCHWALYCDNYLEGFHIPFVHPDLNDSLDYENYDTEIYDYVNLQIGASSDGEDVFELPEDHPDYGKNIAAYYYWIFPNMMFNFYPWGLSVNIIKPISIKSTKVSFLTFVYDENKLNSGAGALLDKVEREDEFVVEGVHKGLQSRFYKNGRFSPTREKGVHHFHRLLAKYMQE